jgi:hypothetical protein
MSLPTILIVTTQTWLQVTRLALRFAHYGATVKAACPAASEMAFCSEIKACFLLSTFDPVASLRRACRSAAADFVVPADDRAVWLLHELGRRYPTYQPLVERSLGSAASFLTVRSRVRLLHRAESLGIATAATCAIESLSDVEEHARAVSQPFFLKKDGTFGGGGVRLVASPEAASLAYLQLSRPHRFKDKLVQRAKYRDSTAFARLAGLGESEISAQKAVKGVAANAMYACFEGAVLGEVQAKVVSAKGETGAALMIVLIKDARITEAGVRLAASLKLSGFFGLDFILEEGTGTPILIEMNPRCTQLGHVAVANQPDLAGMLWSRWTGSDVPQCGSPDLSPCVSFFPQALEWDGDSFFHAQSRFDVCMADLPIVDALGKGNPSRKARLHRGARRWIRNLRMKETAQQGTQGTKIHYFADRVAIQVDISRAAQNAEQAQASHAFGLSPLVDGKGNPELERYTLANKATMVA